MSIGPSMHRSIPLLRSERGIALPLALLTLLVMSIVVAGTIDFSTANSRNASLEVERVTGRTYAETGMQAVFSLITKQNTSGGNPSAANLLGCGGATGPSDTNGPSNC